MTAQPDYPRAPAHVQPYVEVLGVRGAMDFLTEFGGSEIYLAANPKTRSMIVQRIGHDRMADLAVALGRMMTSGRKLRVPTAKPWLAACLRAEGLTTAEIARSLRAADTTVRGWLARDTVATAPQTDPRQLRLL